MRETLRQGTGFLISGTLAFGVDAAVLAALTRYLGLDPFSARLLAIATAMVFAYFAHRRLTFEVKEPPSLHQFGKFVSIAAAAAGLNYAIYALLLLAVTGIEPLVAMAAASLAAMTASYLGLRFGVFGKPNVRL
jgi:putative flippase GtrA